MARIVGVDIPRNKKVPYSLRYIHGIGLTTAQKLCVEAKVDPDTRVQDLTEEQVVALRDAISSLGFIVEGELRSLTAMNIKRLKDVGTYRGSTSSSWSSFKRSTYKNKCPYTER